MMTGREAGVPKAVPNTTADTPDVGGADSGRTGELLLVHEEDRNRWAAKLGVETVGALTYQFAGGRYVLVSTFVSDAYRHRGLASRLVARALDDIRPTGKKITVICPFVGDFIIRHPDYADLIDPVHPGVGATGSPDRAVPDGEQDAATRGGAAAHSDGESSVSERTARIMVLGAVAYRGPLSRLEIARVFDEWTVGRWATIPAVAIDRQAGSLAAAGLIRDSDSPHPEGAEYHCTESGRTELRRLLLELLNAEDFEPFNLMPLLHFITSLGVAELADGLRRRILYIDEVLAYESAVIADAPADGLDHPTEIVRLNWHRYDADRTWSLGFIGRLYGSAA